ncbi:Crp/Fnr family transcriptional regulator [Aquipuribacter sp. SD81]|uniref:Crp/Fnr family transcriptional regulator n=1 Tax=Aquipuribacter sp. SD81 TaxID=3127703 RepID=UPI003015F8EB
MWPLVATLSDADRAVVLAATRLRRFGRDEVLVHEGDPSDSLHLVESGRLAVRVSTEDGGRVLLNVLGPGSHFGELSLVAGGERRRTATVVALEPSATRTLSASAFADLRRRRPETMAFLLAALAQRVEELSVRLVESTYDSLDRRVCSRLAQLVEVYAEGPGPVAVPLTQDLIAELTGGTRPSVNQALQRLARRGVVELARGRVTVIDRDRLAARARLPRDLHGRAPA